MKNGWQKKKLDDVCQFINGLWKGETPPFINIGVFRKGGVPSCQESRGEFVIIRLKPILSSVLGLW